MLCKLFYPFCQIKFQWVEIKDCRFVLRKHLYIYHYRKADMILCLPLGPEGANLDRQKRTLQFEYILLSCLTGTVQRRYGDMSQCFEKRTTQRW